MSNSPISPKSIMITSSPACNKNLIQSPQIDKSNVTALRTLKNEVADLQCETSYLQSELELTKNELFKSRNDAEAKGRRILRLENELFVAQNGKADETCGRRRRRSAVGREKELREEVRLLESINSSLNKDLDSAHSNAHILTDRVSELEKEKIKLGKQNAELEDSIAFLKGQVEANEKLISELQLTCQDLRDVLEESSENSALEKRSLNRSLLACDSAALEEPLTSVVEIKYSELESKFKMLESDFSSTQAKICEKDRELVLLKEDLDTKMAEITSLVNDLEKEKAASKMHDDSKVKLEEMVQLLKEEIETLHSGMAKQDAKLTMLECRNFDLQEEVGSLNNLMFDSEMELTFVKNEWNGKSKSITDYEEIIRIKDEQIEYYRLEKSNNSMSMEALNERIADLNADNQYIHAINEALVIDNNNQKLSISRLKNEKIDDTKKLAILSSLYDETNASLQHKISLIGQLEEKIALANKEKDAEVNRLNDALKALEVTLAEQISIKESLERKINDLENEVSELQEKNSELNQQIMYMHEEDRQSCDVMKSMTDKLTEFEGKIKLKCQREKDLEEEISRLKKELEGKSHEVSLVSESLEGEIKEKENIIGTLNKELDMVKKLYESEREGSKLLRANSDSTVSLLDAKSQELVNLREELSEARKSLSLQTDLLESHKKACEVQMSLSQELEESKRSIQSLRNELDLAKSIIEDHSTLHLKLTTLQEIHESTLKELQSKESNLKLELESERAIFRDLQCKANQIETELVNSKLETQKLVDRVNQNSVTISEKDEMIQSLNCGLEKLREMLQSPVKECDLTEIAEYVKSEISSLSKDRDSTIQELLCAKQELESLKRDVALLKEENVNLNNMLEQVQGNLDMEIEINSDLKKELELTMTSTKSMKIEIDKINNELTQKSSDLDALKEILSKDEEIKNELSHKLSEAQFHILKIDENYNKVIDNIKIDYSAQLGLKDVEIKKLNEELESVGGSLHSLRDESSTLISSVEQLKQENSKLGNQLKEVSGNLMKRENFIKNTSSELSSSSEKLLTAQSELALLENTIQSMQEEVQEISKSEKSYMLKVEHLNEKLQLANDNIERLNMENHSSKDNIELLQNKINNLESTCEEITNINNLLKSSVSDYEAKLVESTLKIKSMENQVSELDSNMLENDKFEEQVFLQLQLLDQDLSILKDSNLALSNCKQNLIEVLSYSLQKCRDMHKTLSKKDAKISSMSDKIDGLVSQMGKIQSDLSSTVESNQLLQSTIDSFNAHLINTPKNTSENEVDLLEENKNLANQVASNEEELLSIQAMLNHSNDLVNAKNIGISNLECEKYDHLMEISQLQGFIADLSEVLYQESSCNNEQSILANNPESTRHVEEDDRKFKYLRLLCYKNYRSLKHLLCTVHQVFGEESIIVRGDNLLVDALSEPEDSSSTDFNQVKHFYLLEREQQIISSLKDQLEMIIVVLKEKNDRLSQVSKMRTDAEQNLRQAKDRATLLEDEIFKLQLEVETRESYIQELEKLRLHETGLLRNALETREESIEHLRERISYLEDSESRLTVELKVKVEELTKLSFDLGTKLKQAYFERDTVTATASDKESALNKNITLLENLIKEKEDENTKLQQGIKMLEHEKSVLDRRVCFLTKDLEDLKKLRNSSKGEFAGSSDLQLTDEQKLTLKPSLQKELRSCFKSAMEEAIAESDDLVNVYKEKLREAEAHIEELSIQLWETADKQVESQHQVEMLSAQLASLQNKLDTMNARALDQISIGLEGVDNPGLEEISDDQIVMPPEPAPQTSERGSSKKNTKGRPPQASLPRFSILSGKVFPVADEDEEMFDETCLADLKAGIVRLNSRPQARYLSCPPQGILSDEHRRSSGARSSLYSERPKKEVGQISYHKPGPPTPSKNGRLSLSDVSPPMSDKPEPTTVEFDKENHGKIKSLFTAKSKMTQVPVKKKGFFRRKFGRENSSTNV